ncbi:hypothetical protein [Clostridium sp. D43t1_170807_H7]|uniref:hypothetical protein n=1 Tax=Clostridium sp. D43t1_170807_H7 TaxID=2787140 RepID=UPI0018980CA6|nr:hypothetical protein [Clostridium sp. D43t1_170807_H7]
MKKLNRKKFNIFIAVLIPLLIILTITTTFLIQNLISYITYKGNTINTDSISLKDINLNEVPYISTYYIEPKVSPNEDVIINYYVTDYYHKEYTEEDTSETFTITVKIDGQKDIVKKNVKAGDNSINIGSFKNPGEQKFSIIATDQYSRNSHELFNFFLVEEKNKEEKEYIMTKDDLTKYNIKNIDTYEDKHIATLNLEEPTSKTVKAELEKIASTITPNSNTYTCIIADTVGNGEAGNWWGETIVKYADDYNKNVVMQESTNTRIGLQQLLDDISAKGYSSIKLLPGTYRIDHQESIFIPSNFNLDMNGATIKLNQFTGDKALMITLNNTFDSHVINGTIEGDYYSHDYANSPNNSEWVMGISIGSEAKYSSFENLVVKDITGYGGSNGIAKSRDESLYYTYTNPISIGDSFKLGDIDIKTGKLIESTNRTTSDFISIEGYDGIGYLSVSRYLGYQGNSCNTWNMIAHFYDGEQKYISSVDSYFYRRIGVPDGAKYIKVTILEESYPTDLSVQYFMVPTHCSFKNIKFENNRCVGLAQSAMKDMLVENCEFTKCGQSSAKCAYDAEDGWDMMQDVTFRKLNFHDNPNNDFLTCAGHNFVIEDMIDGKVYFWERTNSYVVRNCDNLDNASLGHTSRKRSGYVRFYDNTVNGNITIGAAEENDIWPLTIKDCNINGRAENIIDTGLYLRCNIDKSNNKDNNWNTALANGNFKDCTIINKSGENIGGVYENCTFEDITGNIHGTFDISNSTINNWSTYAGAYEPSYTFTNCKLNNFEITFDYWHQGATTLFNNCDINNEDFLLKLPHYSMKRPISIINSSFISNGKDGMIVFYDDRTGGSAGELVEQDMLTIENNKIRLDNSEYVVSGINKDTVNNINITFRSNELLSKELNLYTNSCSNNNNIKITNN